MSIQSNIQNKAAAIARLKEHCMCLRMCVEQRYITVMYPAGDFPVHGIRMENSTEGIEKGLLVMERHWNNS